MGNDISCKVIGIGEIRVRLAYGSVKVFTEVRHVPGLNRNLIALGVLDQQGCVFKGEGRAMKVTRGSMAIMKGSRRNTFYTLEGKTIIHSSGLVSMKELHPTKLWHLRLGHVIQRGLYKLDKQGLLGMNHIRELKFCEQSVLGKQKRVKI